MYWFDIIEILRESNTKLTSMEIYAKLKQKRNFCNIHHTRQILKKLFLKKEEVHRDRKITFKCYKYYWKG